MLAPGHTARYPAEATFSSKSGGMWAIIRQDPSRGPASAPHIDPFYDPHLDNEPHSGFSLKLTTMLANQKD